jgi:hypothetical protein
MYLVSLAFKFKVALGADAFPIIEPSDIGLIA